MESSHSLKKVIIPVLILSVAALIFAILKFTKPETPLKEVEERFWPVEVQTVSFEDIRPHLRSFGEIRAGREAELRAQVSGSVTSVHDQLGDGASVRAGDVLVIIDDFDYLATQQEREADLKEAEARLVELQTVLAGEEKLVPGDKQQVAIAGRELERQRKLLKRAAVSKKAFDDAQSQLNDRKQNVLVREQTLARVKTQIVQAQSSLEKAKTALSKARRDVEDTRLKAPFDGFLTDTDVTEGKQVSTSDRLGRLISLENLEASFHVSEADYARLTRTHSLAGRKVAVTVRRGGDDMTYEALINRIDARVDAATGGRKVFAALSGLTLETDLRPGVFVEVSIPDDIYKDVVALPKRALHDGGIVYVVHDGRLQKRMVEIAATDGDRILIAGGLKAGDQICVTRFAQMGDGILVKVAGS
ncbi:efflux RND transporter periplasmic adaptor subunit [Terasakiella sp. A23]|uniref:efflux RND transporter periplasmic adaptor subunit n=1 Tax=Terasakiella sp. FCG-A23 TaxID=3080561 RepID=UPI002953A14D|nr:efflux RND transporter periplasmic adaptor subunit [Terasakiella sp. A23]MDV7338014.1 efflux RND transporter periplasmic adaptor subunit [Terasakiella sp. A23]